MSARTDIATAILAARRRREDMFGEDLFGDPAWDILLDLYASEARGVRVKTSSVGALAAISPTTSLRWLDILSERGLVLRTRDTGDGRRVFVQLSASGRNLLEALLDSFSAELIPALIVSAAIDR
jgi:DNA-binding MarR family transcriptional regulator